MVTVVTPPVHTALSTLATLREEIPAAATVDLVSDTRLTRLLNVATGAIVDYVGPVAQATYQDRFSLSFRDGYVDAHPLTLTVRPVASLVSVGQVLAADLGGALDLDQTAGLLRVVQPLGLSDTSDLTSPAGGCDILGWFEYAAGLPYLTIQYVGGYAMPEADEPTLPPQIEQAAIEAVRYLLAAPRDPSIRSEMVQGVGSTTYNAAFGTLPDHVMAMLEPYHEATI